MENKGFIFIPDISGFSRFVAEMEIEHSRLIIQELLEILIDANQMDLKISEIEGDAILFYKFGERPSLREVYMQVEKMFCAFHKSLAAYESRRYCQCQACLSAINLTLKVITHYGEFTDYTVKQFQKLIGKDIVIAHQLLKNDIVEHEYWLITSDLSGSVPLDPLTDWMQWNASSKTTEKGLITFHYTQLGGLKRDLPVASFPEPDLSGKVKVMTLSREFETDMITLFHATGDFSNRHRWMEGIKKVEVENHFLPRVGMRCRMLMNNGERITFSSSYFYQEDRIQFSETEEDTGTLTYYTLEKINSKKARLTVDYYIKNNIVSKLVFNMVNNPGKKVAFNRSLNNLADLLKQ